MSGTWPVRATGCAAMTPRAGAGESTERAEALTIRGRVGAIVQLPERRRASWHARQPSARAERENDEGTPQLRPPLARAAGAGPRSRPRADAAADRQRRRGELLVRRGRGGHRR